MLQLRQDFSLAYLYTKHSEKKLLFFSRILRLTGQKVHALRNVTVIVFMTFSPSAGAKTNATVSARFFRFPFLGIPTTTHHIVYYICEHFVTKSENSRSFLLHTKHGREGCSPAAYVLFLVFLFSTASRCGFLFLHNEEHHRHTDRKTGDCRDHGETALGEGGAETDVTV